MRERYGAATRDQVLHFLTFDAAFPSSILSCLQNARENARTIRETISSEAWEQLNNFYHLVRDASRRPAVLDSPQDFFAEVKLASHLFQGLIDATMSHGEGWHFARLGRMLERADKTSRIVDVKYYYLLPKIEDVGTPMDDLHWSAVLRSVSGFEMFRKRHHGITPERVVGFLILDRLFPRSMMRCLNAADKSLHAVSGSPLGTFWNPAEKRMGQLRAELAYATVQDILREGLHEFLDSFQLRLNQVGDAIHDTFFALRPIESWERSAFADTQRKSRLQRCPATRPSVGRRRPCSAPPGGVLNAHGLHPLRGIAWAEQSENCPLVSVAGRFFLSAGD